MPRQHWSVEVSPALRSWRWFLTRHRSLHRYSQSAEANGVGPVRAVSARPPGAPSREATPVRASATALTAFASLLWAVDPGTDDPIQAEDAVEHQGQDR